MCMNCEKLSVFWAFFLRFRPIKDVYSCTSKKGSFSSLSDGKLPQFKFVLKKWKKAQL
jgi:hypothetical protein